MLMAMQRFLSQVVAKRSARKMVRRHQDEVDVAL
jgi:hypothetical protein